jgi:two-component system cell cycle response regulator
MGSPSQGPPTAISFPPERAKAVPRPQLLILSGPEIGSSVELDNQPLEIGRDPDCGITLTGDGVSRRHARIQLIFALYFVTDLESTNGTFVNDQRVNMQQLKDGDQIKIGETVLKFVANPLEVQYSKKVLGLATTDALTGIANKQQFDLSLERALQHAHKSGTALSLILFDVDHFKLINDKFGHAAGDAVLAGAARIVAAALPADASQAERIRAAVAGEPVTHEGRRVPLTVSLGVAELGPGEGSGELYARADQQLYHSKREGRNRVS